MARRAAVPARQSPAARTMLPRGAAKREPGLGVEVVGVGVDMVHNHGRGRYVQDANLTHSAYVSKATRRDVARRQLRPYTPCNACSVEAAQSWSSRSTQAGSDLGKITVKCVCSK